MKKQMEFNLYICIILLLSSLAGCIAYFATQKYGPGVTHDSVAYLETAKTFAAGQGLQYFGFDSPFIQWPPLFPIILASAHLSGIDMMVFANIFNASCIVLSLAILGCWLLERLENRIFAPLFVLGAMCTFGFMKMALYVWSEPSFMMLCTLVFVLLFTKKELTWKKTTVLGILTALACLDRYIGIVLIATVCVYLLFTLKTWRHRISMVFLYGTLSCFPMILWLIRNHMLTKTLVGVRTPSSYPLMMNIERAADTILSWFFPSEQAASIIGIPATYVILSLAVIFLVTLFAFILINKKKNKAAILCLAFFSAFYTLYMILSATRIMFDPIGDRYMIPVFLPLALVLVLLLDYFLSGKKKPALLQAMKIMIALAMMVVWISYGGLGLIKGTQDAAAHGAGGYNSDVWRDDESLNSIPASDASSIVYSNNPAPIAYLKQRISRYLPRKDTIPMYGYEAFEHEIKKYATAYILWYGEETSNTTYVPAEIAKGYDVQKIASGKGFSTYKINVK